MSAQEVILNAIWYADPPERNTRRILTALRAAGYAVVPREPTELMLWRGWAHRPNEAEGNTLAAIGNTYRAMLVAAEKEPQG